MGEGRRPVRRNQPWCWQICVSSLLVAAACTDIVPGQDRFAADAATTDAATTDATASTCPATCDDGNPCTADSCKGGACQHLPQSGGRCLDGQCAPTWTLLQGLCLADSAALDVGAVGGQLKYTKTVETSLYVLPPGNLLRNGGAEKGLDDWQVIVGGDGWAVSTAPLFGSKSFRSSYGWSELAQTVDLLAEGYTAEVLDAEPPVHAVVFAVSTQEPQPLDSFRLTLDFLGADGKVLSSWSSGDLQAPFGESLPRTWGVADGSQLTLPKTTRKLRYRLAGRDGELWKGHFGALHDGLSVTVGKLEVRYSNDKVAWSIWQPYGPVVAAWQLAPELGPKTVYAQFRDGAGRLVGPIEFSTYLGL